MDNDRIINSIFIKFTNGDSVGYNNLTINETWLKESLNNDKIKYVCFIESSEKDIIIMKNNITSIQLGYASN